MPILSANTEYSATAKFPVKPAGLECETELWLSKDGATKDASSGIGAFTSTGVEQSISFPVTTPEGGYSYRVFLDVKTAGITIGAHEATEQVIIPWVGLPVIEW